MNSESIMQLTTEHALVQAVEAHKAGKLHEAEVLYRAILQSEPLHPDANHNLGVLAVAVNQADAALPLFKKALEANASQGQYWLSYIDALIQVNQFDSAKEVLSQGKSRGLAGERVDALQVQLTAILLAQTTEPSPNQKKPTYTQLRKKVAADKGKNTGPSQSDLNALLEHYQTGQYDLAENLAKAHTQKYPDHQFSWKVLGALFKLTGRLEESLAANVKAVDISPKDAEALYNLGITLHELGRLEEAEKHYKKAIAIEPNSAETHYNLGITLQGLGRHEEAQTSYKKAIAIKPAYAQAHYNLGLTLQGVSRLEEAAASYKKAIAIAPGYAEAHSNLGVTLQELGRLDEAAASLKQAISIKQDYAEAYSNLGITLKEMRKAEEAETSFRKAIFINPELKSANASLGRLLMDKNQHIDGLALLKKACGYICFDVINGVTIH
jgi:tetratricopeptide (TPR) repeat protein